MFRLSSAPKPWLSWLPVNILAPMKYRMRNVKKTVKQDGKDVYQFVKPAAPEDLEKT